MKLSNCPNCGAPPQGTLELIYGVSLVAKDEEGDFFFVGETEVSWNTQETQKDPRGRVVLECRECGSYSNMEKEDGT